MTTTRLKCLLGWKCKWYRNKKEAKLDGFRMCSMCPKLLREEI